MSMSRLSVLAVDDEIPALEELRFLLSQDARVDSVHTATDATEALRHLRERHVDIVFLDIRMPGLSGMELARTVQQFATPPAIVFISAYEEYAREAFEVDAVDYLLKPPTQERLGHALSKATHTDDPADSGAPDPLELIPIDLGRRTRLLRREEVLFVEAAGDYVRLHTLKEAVLMRVPLSVLEERWVPFGFCRIHRSYLVALHAVTELRTEGNQMVLMIGVTELPVSRRHIRELRDRLVRAHAGTPRRDRTR
jgi:DNA-binding LytR/AlgR family response regulator